MPKIKALSHFLIIVSLLFAGFSSIVHCLGEMDSNSSVVSYEDKSSDGINSQSLICSQSNCHSHCKQIINARSASNFALNSKNLFKSVNDQFALSNLFFLPIKPPKA